MNHKIQISPTPRKHWPRSRNETLSWTWRRSPGGRVSSQEARKWKTSAWRPKARFTGTGLFMFQLSAAPGCRPPDRIGKKLQSRDVAVASVPPCSFLRAFGSKNGGTEATATVFRQLLG